MAATSQPITHHQVGTPGCPRRRARCGAAQRAFAFLVLLLGLFSPAAGLGTLTVVDNKEVSGGPGDVVVVPPSRSRPDTYVVSMAFNSGEAVTHRMESDGTLTSVGRTAAGPEPRAVALAVGGALAVIANSIANQLGVFKVGNDGLLSEINRVPSGGQNPYDVAVAFGHIVLVPHRDSNQLDVWDLDRQGNLTPLGSQPTGQGPHMVAVSSRGLIAVGNQIDETLDVFSVTRAGLIVSHGTVPLDNMVPRAGTWLGRNLFVALDAPFPAEDVIRAFHVTRNGEIEQVGDTPAGAFLTDLEATSDALFAVTVNRNNPADPADDRDEVRAYEIDHPLTQVAAVQTPGQPPSFKQVATGPPTPEGQPVVTTEFQGGWMRSLIYTDEGP